jgi:tRNA pseudouridine38-40 synthase
VDKVTDIGQPTAARCFRATVQYDGTEFRGFQWQHGERTVQGELQRALLSRTGEAACVTGAGRTDAGVHATGQVVSFSATTRIPAGRIALALNTALPRDITVEDAHETDAEFSARFSASSRVYEYQVWNRSTPSALWRRYAAFCSDKLDVAAMTEAARYLPGEQDFAAFANQIEPDAITMRNVMRCQIIRRHSLVIVRIEANAFLRGMVRIIVGTLIEIGRGRWQPATMQDILRSRDRRQAGPSAPAEGLCLKQVKYGERKNYLRRDVAATAAHPAARSVLPRRPLDETSDEDSAARAANDAAGGERNVEEPL